MFIRRCCCVWRADEPECARGGAGRGVSETGCTIHQVTEEVDGGPIVLQKHCPVLPGDTLRC